MRNTLERMLKITAINILIKYNIKLTSFNEPDAWRT